MNRFGEILGPIMKSQGWTEARTHAETLQLANRLGESPDILRGQLFSLGKTSDQVAATMVASRMLIDTQATDLFRAVRAAHITGEGKSEALAKLRPLAETLASFKTVQTGAARATESGRIAVAGVDPERLTQFLKSAGSEDDLLRKIAMTEGDPT